MNMRVIERALMAVKRRAMATVARAIIESVDDSKKMQLSKLKLLAGENRTDVERMQEYGFTSVPQDGAEGCAVFPLGNRENGIIIACDDRRFRLTGLEKGEVALYTDEGDKIHFQRGNKIQVTTKELTIDAETKTTINTAEFELNAPITNINASTEVAIDSPIITQTGDLQVSGDIIGESDIEGQNKIEALVEMVTPTISFASFTGTGPSGATGTGNLELTGEFKATEVEDSVGKLSGLRSNYNSHVHSNPEGGNVGPANPTDP